MIWAVAARAVLEGRQPDPDNPVALLVDDAREGDTASLEFLSYLARRAGDLLVLVVLATRPTEPNQWPAALTDEAQSLQLEPLSLDAVAALRFGVIGKDDTPMEAACLAASGGSPFFLTELLAELATAEGTIMPSALAGVMFPGFSGLAGEEFTETPPPPFASTPARSRAVAADQCPTHADRRCGACGGLLHRILVEEGFDTHPCCDRPGANESLAFLEHTAQLLGATLLAQSA